MDESHGGKFDLGNTHEVNKMISLGMIMDFDNFLTVLLYLGEIFLVHCMVSVHSPCLWTNFEGVIFLSKLVYGDTINTYHFILMNFFYFYVEFPYIQILVYLPILSFLLLHSPHSHVDGTLVGVVLELCLGYLIPNIGYIMYVSILSFPYYL